MVTSNHVDVRRSLEAPLSEEDAIAIMEGRLPAEDSAEVVSAARQIALGLEQLEQPGKGGAVPPAQPWMKMAAALMVGVLLTTVVNVRMQVAGVERETGVITANVAYLDNEVFRGGGIERTVLRVTNDSPLTLIAYPDFTNADQLGIFVERRVSDAESWQVILQSSVEPPTEDAVAVNLAAEMLEAGVHRLRIEAFADKQLLATLLFEFEIE